MERNNKGQFVKDKMSGKNNYFWKGDDVGYHGIHQWLAKQYGKANKCEHPDCNNKSQKFHWSLIKGKKYKRKRENFWKLCVLCHIKYDENIGIKGKSPWNKGKKGLQVAWNKDKKYSWPHIGKHYTFQGKTLNITEWAKLLDIEMKTLSYRINRWPLEKALTSKTFKNQHDSPIKL